MKFPPTERAASGVSMGEMFRELLNPMFIVLFSPCSSPPLPNWLPASGWIWR